MQGRDEERPDLPDAPAPTAPKKTGKAVKMVGIIVGGVIVVSAIGAVQPKPVGTSADTTDRLESPSELAPTTAPEVNEPEFTAGQENAIGAAESYLDTMAFSESGLIDQLEFEKYSAADARFAVNHIKVDWNEQAAKSAQDYLDSMSFSRQGLIDQLEYEGFTAHQAIYGVNTTGL